MGRNRLTQAEFLEKAKAIHADKYDLSRTIYTGNNDKVEVICHKHGPFYVVPRSLVIGIGCPKCGREKAAKANTITQQEFLDRAEAACGGKYDLRAAIYKGALQKVEAICPEHGSWWVFPSSLLRGYGCPKCAGKAKLTQEEFEGKVLSVHGTRYDLRKARYVSNTTKVEIICPEHGSWRAIPTNLFKGTGCPKCAGKNVTQEEFLEKAKAVHGEKYDLSMVIYEKSSVKIEVICPEHGSWWITPNNFLRGCGCPKCSNNGKSKGEDSVAEYIESLGMKVERGRRDIISPLEIDIFIPEKNLGIEYNGHYYHGESRLGKTYHYKKFKMCSEKGIRLVQILDLAWQTRQNQIKSFLSNALGVIASDKKIDTRNCEVRQVKVGELREFLNTNHIRGHCHTGSIALALFSGSEIVSAMVFGKGTNQRGAARKGKDAVWTLSRYAASENIPDGFQKLLDHGRDLIGWEHDIIGFSSNDFSDDYLYRAAGFVKDAEIGSDYQVFHPKNGLHHKSHWQRRMIPARLAEIGWEGGFDPATDKRTEWEIEDQVGAVRVWDSGKIRWRIRGTRR